MDGHPLQDEVKNNQPPPPPTLPTIPPTNLRKLEEQLPHPHPKPNPIPTSLDGHPTPTKNKDDIVREDDLLGYCGLDKESLGCRPKNTKGEHPDINVDPPSRT